MIGILEIPPLHPILVHFPVALLPFAVACDVVGRWTGRTSLSHAAWWALLFAALASPLTAASGWLWLADMDGMMHHTEMVIHQWLGVSIPILLIPLTLWRYRFHARDARISIPYMAFVTAMVAVVMMQGHIGGMMTFGTTPAVQTPSTNPLTTTRPLTNDDGWSDSIHVKDHHP